jgi:hypothetical protein
MKKLFVLPLLLCSLAFACNPSELQVKQEVRGTLTVEQIPPFTDTYSLCEDKEPFSNKQIAVTIAFFYIEWKQVFGDPDLKVLMALNNLTILWDKMPREERDVYSTGGKFYPSALVAGLTLNPKFIWVWVPNGIQSISGTSFVHELVHISLWAQSGIGGDADHEGDNVKLWTHNHTLFIEEVNATLKENNI